MRTEHALMVEEMQSWDRDPIWLAYEEEANKLVWDINQKYARAKWGVASVFISAGSDVRLHIICLSWTRMSQYVGHQSKVRARMLNVGVLLFFRVYLDL